MKSKSVVLSIFVLFLMMIIPIKVYAVNVATIEIVSEDAKKEYQVGEIIKASIQLVEARSGAESLGIGLTYDSKKLELLDCSKEDIANLVEDSVKGSIYLVCFSNQEGKTLKTGTIASMKFKVKEGATGSTTIDYKNVILTDTDETQTFEATTKALSIKFISSYNPTEGEETINKEKAAITFRNLEQKESHISAVQYDVSPKVTDGKVTVEYKIDGIYGTKLPTKAGEYDVRVSIVGDSRLEDITQTERLIIQKIEEQSYSGGTGKTSGGGGGGGSSSTISYEIKVTNTMGGTISPSTTKVKKGEIKIFTITAKKGYVIEEVLVDGESKGKITSYTFEDVNEEHTITAKFVKESEIQEGTKESTNSFKDVNSSDWFYDAVNFAVKKKLFNGVSQTQFAPNTSMTRGMLVTVLYRLANATNKEESTFADVKEGSYYSAPIAWAAKNGIVNGVGNNNFAPDKTISREDLATIIARYIQNNKIELETEKEDEAMYVDVALIANYAKESVNLLREKGLMTGKTATTFDPRGMTTRAEVATLMMRLVNKEK